MLRDGGGKEEKEEKEEEERLFKKNIAPKAWCLSDLLPWKFSITSQQHYQFMNPSVYKPTY